MFKTISAGFALLVIGLQRRFSDFPGEVSFTGIQRSFPDKPLVRHPYRSVPVAVFAEIRCTPVDRGNAVRGETLCFRLQMRPQTIGDCRRESSGYQRRSAVQTFIEVL